MEKKKAVKTDIKDTKEALDFGFALIGAIKASKESEGGIGINDLGNLVVVLPKFSPAIEGADTIPAELKDLDKDEAKELMEFASMRLGESLNKKELVEKIEKALKAVLAVFEAVKAWS